MVRQLALLFLVFINSCTTVMERSYSISDAGVLDNSHDIVLFENENFKVDPLNTVTIDVALPKNKINPPLAIILHGNHSTKEAHRNQILALAKSGIVAMAIQFTNTGQWFENGGVLAKALPGLKRGFNIKGHRVKCNSMILVGHSFGGYAAAVAAGRFGKIDGVILLDPAMYDSRGPAYISKISAPLVIIGADKAVFRSRKRDLFFESANQKAIELSVIGATHDDAQNPSMFALSSYGVDPYTSKARQKFITKLLVESAKALTTRSGLKILQSKLNRLEKQSKISSLKIRQESKDENADTISDLK